MRNLIIPLTFKLQTLQRNLHENLWQKKGNKLYVNLLLFFFIRTVN